MPAMELWIINPDVATSNDYAPGDMGLIEKRMKNDVKRVNRTME
jgi:hypothetical protein